MEFIGGQEYTKDCRDFEYTGVECCVICHEMSDFDVLQIDGEPALLCCKLRRFFYPSGYDRKNLTPEEKLLRAIFGESDGHEDEQAD